jgi:drug/metabolite transporter (DMT)-like permease
VSAEGEYDEDDSTHHHWSIKQTARFFAYSPEKMRFMLATLPAMAVTSFIYLLINLLAFYNIRRLDATTMVVGYQFKLVATAVCSKLYLGKQFPMRQYRSMLLVTLGIIIV